MLPFPCWGLKVLAPLLLLLRAGCAAPPLTRLPGGENSTTQGLVGDGGGQDTSLGPFLEVLTNASRRRKSSTRQAQTQELPPPMPAGSAADPTHAVFANQLDAFRFISGQYVLNSTEGRAGWLSAEADCLQSDCLSAGPQVPSSQYQHLSVPVLGSHNLSGLQSKAWW